MRDEVFIKNACLPEPVEGRAFFFKKGEPADFFWLPFDPSRAGQAKLSRVGITLGGDNQKKVINIR
ncbi:MAG: hypothetical protein COY19_05740 [Candidatus Marinimicrobia bacterium CG_4_10_14_0_2_um_filter_48_9]|nr:MAG: hypothetical protein COY19_05740 [Candidatus Marinimicrobia bacterium CG_4_10_14_0_2_um_filter_48_9]